MAKKAKLQRIEYVVVYIITLKEGKQGKEGNVCFFPSLGYVLFTLVNKMLNVFKLRNRCHSELLRCHNVKMQGRQIL